jgi:hypothetical protein
VEALRVEEGARVRERVLAVGLFTMGSPFIEAAKMKNSGELL